METGKPGRTSTPTTNVNPRLSEHRGGDPLEERTDLNQIYDLEHRIAAAHYVVKDEVETFAQGFFKGSLTH